MKILRFSALWCPSCLIMKTRWNQIVKSGFAVPILDFDYDLDEQMVQTYRVGTLLPVVIFVQDDREILRVVGEKSVKELKKILEGLGL